MSKRRVCKLVRLTHTNLPDNFRVFGSGTRECSGPGNEDFLHFAYFIGLKLLFHFSLFVEVLQ